jgi:hypothetical protein
MDPKSILEMARGAITERVDYEMSRVMDNIMDANTKPTEKRKITLTIEFTPDDDRQTIAVSVTAKSTLAATTPIKTALYASVDSFGEFHAVEMTPQVPGQLGFDGSEAAPAPVLRIAK